MEHSTRSFRASLAAMLGICLVIMLIALDSTVVGTAMPRIVAELRGYDLYQWIASAYLMGSAVMIPITGRLGDLYGRKPFVLLAVVLFTAASAACGLAQTILQLVLARGVQGLAGGMLVGVAFACVPDLFPDRLQRVRWQVMLSASFGVASALGPALGGWMTEHAGWRSVFYVNLPVALLALPVIWRYLPHIVHHDGEEERSIDWLGALLMAAGICGLLLATERGQVHGFGNPLTLGLCVLALVCGGVFIWHQHHSRAPIIPPRLLANQGARQLMLLGLSTGMTMFVLVFYSPLMLQGGFGYSPALAGFVMTPLLVSVTLGSIVNGRVLPRMKKAERMIAWGQFGTLLSSLLLSQVGAGLPQGWMMAAFALCGFSLGFQLPNLTLQMMAAAGKRDLGVGSAMIQTTRMLGSMIGVGVAGVIVNAAYVRHIGAELAARHLTEPALVELLASPQLLIRQQDQATLLTLAQQIGVDAAALLDTARLGLVGGIHTAFLLCAVLAGLSIFISWRLPPYEIAKNR
ncbi:MFS transporter [Uliginosibacterium sp. 31-16]|uniref:MFS transporter n=1 Tax=Uliginosibacterium sp. 31-16 TaxID=3068315 RepID=UPI00273F42E6|nr:MFS transporter [Uliginosibacterium sp. 31-16]MDP5238938.1 MFS transporter [Uliginosibacterium sp. 31-16]